MTSDGEYRAFGPVFHVRGPDRQNRLPTPLDRQNNLDTRGPISQPHTGDRSGTAGAASKGNGGTSANPLLGLSLFWKIFLANLALVGVSAAAGAWLATALRTASSGTVLVAGILLGAVVILVSLGVNAGLVRVALSPLAGLRNTAARIRSGDLKARAAQSAVADASLRQVVSVFNEMLDVLSLNQTRQQELARRVLESEERERQLIAHELYSGTAQTLAGVLVRLRIAERHQASGATGSIEEIRQQVVEALEEVRGVARRLRPPELDELGVKVALEAHARSMTEGRRLETRFKGSLPELSREVSLALFRILQEAISNAAIHSGADTLSVSFETTGDVVVAEVADDGTGFDLGVALGQAGGSLGLFGMHERAGYVSGELSIESGPGLGTRVRVAIPMDPNEAAAPRPFEPLAGAVDRLTVGLVEEEAAVAASTAPDPKRLAL